MSSTSLTEEKTYRKSGRRDPLCSDCGKDATQANFYPSNPYLCTRCQTERATKRKLKSSAERQETAAVEPVETGRLVCKHCGKDFEAYKIGKQDARNVCLECATARRVKSATQNRAALDNNTVLLVFGDADRPLLEQLRGMSTRERRTLQDQVLYLVERGIEHV